jgi:hypothetical protein
MVLPADTPGTGVQGCKSSAIVDRCEQLFTRNLLPLPDSWSNGDAVHRANSVTERGAFSLRPIVSLDGMPTCGRGSEPGAVVPADLSACEIQSDISEPRTLAGLDAGRAADGCLPATADLQKHNEGAVSHTANLCPCRRAAVGSYTRASCRRKPARGLRANGKTIWRSGKAAYVDDVLCPGDP